LLLLFFWSSIVSGNEVDFRQLCLDKCEERLRSKVLDIQQQNDRLMFKGCMGARQKSNRGGSICMNMFRGTAAVVCTESCSQRYGEMQVGGMRNVLELREGCKEYDHVMPYPIMKDACMEGYQSALAEWSELGLLFRNEIEETCNNPDPVKEPVVHQNTLSEDVAVPVTPISSTKSTAVQRETPMENSKRMRGSVDSTNTMTAEKPTEVDEPSEELTKDIDTVAADFSNEAGSVA